MVGRGEVAILGLGSDHSPGCTRPLSSSVLAEAALCGPGLHGEFPET